MNKIVFKMQKVADSEENINQEGNKYKNGQKNLSCRKFEIKQN